MAEKPDLPHPGFNETARKSIQAPYPQDPDPIEAAASTLETLPREKAAGTFEAPGIGFGDICDLFDRA